MGIAPLSPFEIACLKANYREGGLVQAKLAFPLLSIERIRLYLEAPSKAAEESTAAREQGEAREEEALTEQPGYIQDWPDPDTIKQMCAQFRARNYGKMVGRRDQEHARGVD